jgi:hypothetical protein
MSISNLFDANDYDIHTGNLYLKTTGSTATSLTYYHEEPFSYALLGGVVNVSLTGTYTKLNDIVTINYNEISVVNSGAPATIYTAAASIPVAFRPTVVGIYNPTIVITNSATVNGMVLLQTDGAIQFYTGTTGNFATSGNNGFRKNSITYKI